MTVTPADQMKVLKRIWKREGYVFLPWIPAAQARVKEQRRNNWNEGPAFKWPADKPRILDHLAEHANDDLYFAPMVFSEPTRRSEFALTGNRLWADLDEVDPRDVDGYYQPTIAWETSPERYAGVWLVNSDRTNVTAPGRENHKLTAYLGADPSGWDTTQLLRVPGSANNKPGKPKGTRGSLLWADREIHTWGKFDELPDVKVAHTEEVMDEQILSGIDRHAVWGRVKAKVHKGIRKFMAMRDTGDYDRSDVLWQIERELADAGCTLPEIVAIIRPTVWNKFAGRQDEIKRLMTESSKAISQRADSADVYEEEVEKPGLKPFWEDEDYLNAPDPEWLIPDMIPKGGCGFIAGIPKSMKSWISLDLAISLTTGEAWLENVVPEPMNVLYIQAEDPATLVKKRHTMIAGSKNPKWEPDLRNPYPGKLYMEIYNGFDGTDLSWQTWLGDTIRDHDIHMVIMDTLATIAPGVDIDSGREVKGELLDPIKAIARDTGAAVLIVHHMTKSAVSERAGQNMAGSGQIHAWADFLVAVNKKEERLGTTTITFDHETKYTGTNTMRFMVEGLDEGRWLPTMVRGDDQAHQGTTPNRSQAAMKEAVGNPKTVDPLADGLELSAVARLKRAYVKVRAESAMADHEPLDVHDLMEVMGVSKQSIMKTIQHLNNDYPDLKPDLAL
ncbi:RecA-like DNA recombinase [Gordonia phage Dre3]|uniref:RecA-like DNA recombinase n=1 Tax=Gordonia phage Gibbous TaxID=2652405 RepID=A0A5J6T6Y8_9CAUD|nr:RecA-like DNA recombinase [Gordonia phage Gibbous]QFG05130.1 RecA-like DNA recombinase [Gordonia phage Gibbous]QRI45983.1 RecA-like DNA recombinase [Gordonia phage Dre3]